MKQTNNRPLKVTRTSVVEQVCELIKQDVVSKRWNPGDKLPSESELAESFGVNRLSVRMALQKLITLGIIETRAGEGSYVRSFSLKPVLNELKLFYNKEDMYKEVQQLRNLLEYECTSLAIASATEQEKNNLKMALDEYHKCLDIYYTDLEDTNALNSLIDADFNFHYTVVKISHNRLYKDVYYMVQELIRDYMTQILKRRFQNRKEADLAPIQNDNHDQIYQCIVQSNPDILRLVMDEMLGIVPINGMDIFD